MLDDKRSHYYLWAQVQIWREGCIARPSAPLCNASPTPKMRLSKLQSSAISPFLGCTILPSPWVEIHTTWKKPLAGVRTVHIGFRDATPALGRVGLQVVNTITVLTIFHNCQLQALSDTATGGYCDYIGYCDYLADSHSQMPYFILMPYLIL